MGESDKLVYINSKGSVIDYKELKFNIDVLYNLICRNKTDRVLTPEEFRVIDKLYERLKLEYSRLIRESEE